jgi:hypothetical protein
MTNTLRRVGIAFVCALASACGGSAGGGSQATGESTSALVVTAAGSIPAGLPSHLSVGLFEQSGATWMKGSGVPWDLRYAYFTYGWANNWGYGSRDGSWGLNYMKESSGEGFVPAVEYYCVNGEPGGAEAQFLAKTQNTTTMAEYFGDFKLLMQNIKTFGKPVVVLMEADGFGFLEQQSNGNPNAYAAVAASGLPELASLPNTVAGWGLAFLQLRKAVGATNAILGIHVSDWAGGEDIGYGSVTDALQPQVDTVYGFLSPLGLAANTTGATYDFLVGDPLDRDSDYYKVVENQNRWWDASDTASVNSESFNRYASWLSLWNAKAKKRWILWQIPIGNSNQLDVCNSGQPRQGYKDNRAEYFFGPERAQHLASWAQDGVIGLLFGAGEGCQSSYENDVYTDGQPFLKTHAAAFYAAGGLPLTSAGSSSGGSSSGSSGAGSSSGGSSSGSSGAGSSSGSGSGTPAFTTTATASPASVTAGQKTTITATVKDTGAALSGGVVDIEIYDASSTKVAQQSFTAQSFAASQTQTYSYVWTAPATAGTYTVELGVFGAGWTPDYVWNGAAATVVVAAASGDPAEYGFETGAQGWTGDSGVSSLASSSAEAFKGAHALAVKLNESGAGTATVAVSSPATPVGATVTFHVYIPSGTTVSSVQPFVLQGASGSWTWTGNWQAISSLQVGAWNTLTVAVPANAVTPLYQLGVEIGTSGAATSTVYVDSVSW